MKLTDAIESNELIKDHGNGLIEIKEFRDNKKILCHCFKLNGKKHGEYKLYDDKGTLREHGFWKDSELHGERKVWNNDGILKRHELYENAWP